MTIAKVQSVQGIGPGPSLTGVVAGNFLTASVAYIIGSGNGAATPTVVDSSGQTWNLDNAPTAQGSSGSGWVGVAQFSLPNANAGTHNLTLSVAGILSIAGAFAEWSGMPTSAALDQTGVGGGSIFATQNMSVTAGGVTTQASELVITAMAIETNSGASAAITDPPAGFTSLGNSNTWQSSNFGYEIAYQILSATATPSAAWSWTGAGTTRYQSTIDSYKGATVAANPQAPIINRRNQLYYI